jgi:hypothetical protein
MTKFLMSAVGLVVSLAVINPVEARGGYRGGRSSGGSRSSYGAGRSSWGGSSKIYTQRGRNSTRGKAMTFSLYKGGTSYSKTLHRGHAKRHRPRHAAMNRTAFLAKYATKFAHGYYLKGKVAAKYFKGRRWDDRHHCYVWWCEYTGCWYYWYEAGSCYYPVNYVPAAVATADNDDISVADQGDDTNGNEEK